MKCFIARRQQKSPRGQTLPCKRSGSDYMYMYVLKSRIYKVNCNIRLGYHVSINCAPSFVLFYFIRAISRFYFYVHFPEVCKKKPKTTEEYNIFIYLRAAGEFIFTRVKLVGGAINFNAIIFGRI